jgi:hypothetical protein
LQSAAKSLQLLDDVFQVLWGIFGAFDRLAAALAQDEAEILVRVVANGRLVGDRRGFGQILGDLVEAPGDGVRWDIMAALGDALCDAFGGPDGVFDRDEFETDMEAGSFGGFHVPERLAAGEGGSWVNDRPVAMWSRIWRRAWAPAGRAARSGLSDRDPGLERVERGGPVAEFGELGAVEPDRCVPRGD